MLIKHEVKLSALLASMSYTECFIYKQGNALTTLKNFPEKCFDINVLAGHYSLNGGSLICKSTVKL